MTMILKKDFTSFNYRLFVLPAFTRAFFIKGSPHGELSYNIKKIALCAIAAPERNAKHYFPLREVRIFCAKHICMLGKTFSQIHFITLLQQGLS